MDDLETHATGFDDPMTPGSGGSKLPLVAMLLGLGGVVLGGVGIYMANQATAALRNHQAELAGQADPLAEAFAAYQEEQAARFDDIEGRLGNMGGSIVRLQRQGPSTEVGKQIQQMHTQTQEAFNRVSDEVKSNRSQLNAQAAQIEGIQRRIAGGASVAGSGGPAGGSSSSVGAPTGGSGPTDAVAIPEGGLLHRVEPGETMSSIAKRYGISLAAFMRANPGVDPRRMQIGQEMVIPEAGQ